MPRRDAFPEVSRRRVSGDSCARRWKHSLTGPLAAPLAGRVHLRPYALLFHFCDRPGYPSLNSLEDARGKHGFQEKGLGGRRATISTNKKLSQNI